MICGMNTALQKALEFVGGNQSEMARRISELSGHSVKQQHIRYWLHHQVPPKWAGYIEQVTGGEVSKEELVFSKHDAA